ncbi:coiled-coil domain-containing protein 177 [Syngnathoides biaculeatus]|uniref:coiled-coil domain-containing protein 177 n=1 Tax=Syngnathoides biaculeatus TaxID=300417 RepID=UPI002ADE9197|nr:coiled-coil domain-containing protein 177 [Syngnathoides biaculeatus]XP_061692701.1 coiled-coil domain-containing protein 177 [Syngnathoides biaculeatus]
MGELRSSSPLPHLDLNNFETADAEKSRYVLTSPRSLESCARLGIKPVDLLMRSPNDLSSVQCDMPSEAVKIMHESYEKDRRKLLQMCRDERERIIQQVDRWPIITKVSSLETRHDTKLKSDIGHERTDPIPYAHLCIRDRCASKTLCSAGREPDRNTICSLGDLRHSPAIQKKLQRLTEDIRREMRVPISQTDRKIAALMLVKHQEEMDRLCHRHRRDKEREEACRQEEAQQAQADKLRTQQLMQSVQRWHEELEARRRLRARWEEERAVQLKREMMLHEERWKRQKEQVEAQRRGQMATAHKEAQGRKCDREKVLREMEEVDKRQRDKERQRAVEKEQRARRSKLRLEEKEKKRLQEENRKELLRHILLKQQVDKQVVEEESRLRRALERKTQHSCEKHARDVEARLQELQEQAAREEKRILRAQLKARLQSIQQLTHKQLLVKLSQQRTQRAAEHTSARQKKRAQLTHQHNKLRQLRHLRLRESVQRDEEVLRKVRESSVAMKERRCQMLLRERERKQQEAHKQALASFHLKERVREQTQSRSFAQMAQEAQLAASISRMNL